MAQSPSSAAEHREQRDQGGSKPQLVVVELGKQQTPQNIRRLREGRGKLMKSIDRIVADLVEAGTIKANAQSLVIVVREAAAFPFPAPPGGMPNFGFPGMGGDEDEDEDDEDDEDDDED